jgi:hypothetical protein
MLAAVDPGTEKFGWVLCTDDGDLILSGVCLIGDIELWAGAILSGDSGYLEKSALEKDILTDMISIPEFIIVGSGTGSRECVSRLKKTGLKVRLVPESYSSIRGRELYWDIHPPGGIRKLLPRSMLVPPRSVDDLAAWSLVLHFLENS